MTTAAASVRPGLDRARTARALLDLMRPKCSLGAASYVVLCAWVGGAETLSYAPLVAAAVIGLIVGAAFTFNDVRDIRTDRLIKPTRPLPSQQVSPRLACMHAAMLAASALIAAATLGGSLLACAAAYVCVSALYSTHLKSTVLAGNLTMALLIGSIPVYAGVAVDDIGAKLLLLAAIMFSYSLAQEILFTLEDRDGDREAGLTTTGTWFAPATSLRLYQAAAAAFAVASLLPWLLGISTDAYLYAALVCTVSPTLAAALRLRPNADAKTLRRSADAMGVIWWTSLVPLLLLR